MGPVVAAITLESLADLWAVRRGTLPTDQVRRVVIADALVDSGEARLMLSSRVIHALGLRAVAKIRVASGVGVGEVTMYDAVRLTIQGRSCSMDVIEAPDTTPALVGHIALTHLDLVVDLRGRTLIGNPAHGGVHTYEMY